MDLLVEAELRRAASRPGCVLCRVGEDAALRYIRTVLHEGATDAATLSRLDRSWGFCRRHAWQLLGHEWGAMGDSLGTATVSEGLVDAATHLLDTCLASRSELRRRRGRAHAALEGLTRALAPAQPCPTCQAQGDHEEYAARVLVHSLDDPKWRQQFAASAGLCLSHLRAALAAVDDGERVEWLIEDARRRLRELLLDLEEYGRKHDYRFSEERYGREFDAALRAVEMLAGSWFDVPPRPRPVADRAGRMARVKDGGEDDG